MSTQRFYYMKEGRQQGPVTFAQLQQMISAGQITARDLVWEEGTPSWVRAEEVPGLITASAGAGFQVMAKDRPARAADRYDRSAPIDEPLPPRRRRRRKRVKEDPPALQLVKWLGTTLLGTCVLAMLGVLFICGGAALWLFIKPETQPTRYSVASLEDRSDKPKENWLEIGDAYLYWDLMVGETFAPANVTVEKRHIKHYYVPLVSKNVVDAWVRVNGQTQKFPQDKVRVYVKFSASQLEEKFPSHVDTYIKKILDPRPDTPFQATGTVGNFKAIPDGVLGEMQKYFPGPFYKDRMILLEYDNKPTNPGIFGLCIAFAGLPLLIPLGIWTMRALLGGQRGKARGAARHENTDAGGNFYYNRKGQSLGPVSFAELTDLAARGQLAPHDLIWDEAAQQWQPAQNTPGLF